MPGYRTKTQTVTIAGHDFPIRSLLDTQQYDDPDGEAERIGISSATWSLFGQIWPSARVLAEAMSEIELAGKRILEIGAGLGLASLVLHRRGGDVTMSDWHPLSEAFMEENLKLNELGPMPYYPGDWGGTNPGLGTFSLLIGSDVLYERQHPQELAGFVDRHASDEASVIIVDPMRGNRSHFRREMASRGFACEIEAAPSALPDGTPYKGRFLRFTRG